LHYGVVLIGDAAGWIGENVGHAFAVLKGVSAWAQRLSEGTSMTPVEAFRAAYGIDAEHPMVFDWDPNCSDCRPSDCGDDYAGRCQPMFGHTDSSRRIEFASMSAFSNNRLPDNGAAERALRQRNNVIHELAHAFENRLVYVDAAGTPHKPAREALPFTNRDGLASGTAWRQSADLSSGEIFADMALAWTFDTWNTADIAIGQTYRQWMNRNMPLWIDLAINR
jgi:hypothetical protein